MIYLYPALILFSFLLSMCNRNTYFQSVPYVKPVFYCRPFCFWTKETKLYRIFAGKMFTVIFICGNVFLLVAGKIAKNTKIRTRENFVPPGIPKIRELPLSSSYNQHHQQQQQQQRLPRMIKSKCLPQTTEKWSVQLSCPGTANFISTDVCVYRFDYRTLSEGEGQAYGKQSKPRRKEKREFCTRYKP